MPSPGKMLPFLLYPALGAVVGWASLSTGGPGAGKTAEMRDGHGRTREAREVSAPWKTEEFLKATQEHREVVQGKEYSMVDEILAGWTEAEILAALEEAARDPQSLIGHNPALMLLMRGYVRRDLDAALAWFQGQPEILQTRLIENLAMEWPQERAMEGLEFIRQNRHLAGERSGGAPFILAKCVVEKAGDGAAAVLAFLKGVREEGFAMDFFGDVELPRGFDYRGVLDSPDADLLQFLAPHMRASWLKEDREAVFQWMLEKQGAKELPELLGFNPGETRELVPWFTGKVEKLPAAQRAETMERQGTMWFFDASAARAWIDAAETPAFKEEIRSAAMQVVYSRVAGHVLPVLETLPDGEARLRALETVQPNEATMGSREYISEFDVDAMRPKLLEWGADAARADAIMERIKNPRKP